MRLVEEIKGIKLQIISVILLLITLTITQLADYFINNHNTTISQEGLALLNRHSVLSKYSQSANFFTLSLAFGVEGVNILNLDEIKSGEFYIDEKEKELILDLENNKIDTNTYIVESIKHKRSQARRNQDEYNEGVDSLNELFNNGTTIVNLETWELEEKPFGVVSAVGYLGKQEMAQGKV